MSPPDDDFSRSDETADELSYAGERLVPHLDATALGVVQHLIGSLLRVERPAILDLMASWDSHLPPALQRGHTAGLGLDLQALQRNAALDERVIHDLNRDPRLPWADRTFDAVLNTAAVDYLVHPVEVFREVGRVLKPGGLLLVVFSNRWFEPKVTRIWRQTREGERVPLVASWIAKSDVFCEPRIFADRGRRRPTDDAQAHAGLPADPVYAVWADRSGGPSPFTRRRTPTAPRLAPAELAQRKAAVKDTLCCPYCGERLRKWAVPQTPFTQWPNEHFYVCFNDLCPYFVEGWQAMASQGNVGWSYRAMYDALTQTIGPMPVPSAGAQREHIIE